MASINPLITALSGLRVAQNQIDVTSNNVANVSTDGYSRKSIQQYSTVLDGQGSGVATGNVLRNVNDILLKDFRSQTSKSTGLLTRVTYLDQVQQFHGPPDTNQSISSYVAKLQDTFSQLSNQPENTFLLSAVHSQAEQVVEKFGNFSERLVELRNNTQQEMSQSIGQINVLTEQIAQLNISIKASTALGNSTAELEDKRDLAIREVAKEIDISYFKTQDNVIVVMTKNGQALADTQQTELFFGGSPIGPQSYYPASADPVRLGNAITGTDVTSNAELGGRLGALIELRDDTLPVYHAQLDELAHKLAMRMDSQGLRLFSAADGTIPANTPSSYVGFAADITVNSAVTNDLSLLRKGTTAGSTVQDGSDEVLRKIVQFAFGEVQYQQGTGTVDISNVVPTLFATLGIAGEATITGTTNIESLGSLDSNAFIIPGSQDTFSIQVGAGLPQNVTIAAGHTATDLVNTINGLFPGMAELGTTGELVLTASDDITIAAGTLGVNGLNTLGLTAGATAAIPPSFQIAIGNDTPTTIQILDTDTTTELLAKINALSGISATLTGGGFLQIQPDEGGDLTLIDGLSSPLAALGVTIANVGHTAFNSTNLGPGSNLDGRIQSAANLHDYSTQIVSLQSQDAQNTELTRTTEESYRTVLDRQLLDATGVNIDEELALLITIQTAYNASARTIRIAEEMLDELLNTFR